MIILSKEQVILLHAQLIAETGGAEGVRAEGLLESALYAPFQSAKGCTSWHRTYKESCLC